MNGKTCRNCFHMSEYNNRTHHCTVGYMCVCLEDSGYDINNHSCDCWETAEETEEDE